MVSAKYIFLDVVGFTRNRSVEAQSDIVRALNQIVKGSVGEHQIADDKLLYIPTGDGICIALLNVETPIDIHLQLGLSLIGGVQKYNEATESKDRKFQVRVGINANIDNLVIDVNGQKNIAGAGINMAARIMDKADGNQILVGRSVYDTLRYREKYATAFKSYQATVKHGTVLDIYQFVSEGVSGLNTETPQAFKLVEATVSTSGIGFRSFEKATSLSGIEAKLLLTAEAAFQYMSESVLRAEVRIDHAALAPPIQRLKSPSKKWEESIEKVLAANKIKYRYVALLTDEARMERVRRHLSNPDLFFYVVRYYSTLESVIPALSFILIDQLEVVMHYPYELGQNETYLAIKHPEIGKLFAAYYEKLWNEANELDRSNLTDILKSIKGGAK